MVRFTNIVTKLKPTHRINFHRRLASSQSAADETNVLDDDFRVFDVRGSKPREVAGEKFVKAPTAPSREQQMPTDQDWPSVWPGPRTFHPASVPLPLRQGQDRDVKVPFGKYVNTELMKLPNFLHLTPPAVAKHCAALKKFCTEWPKNLDTEEQIEKHFPLQIITSTYCHSSPKIRDPKARVVTFKFKLSNLHLDKHAKDKIRRLLGARHNAETDEVTLATDRCPVRQQNYEYNQYLILAMFYESWKVETWEQQKEEEDMEYYDWENNLSKKAYISLREWSPTGEEIHVDDDHIENDEAAQAYKEAVSSIFNEGEDINRIFKYKESVLKLVL